MTKQSGSRTLPPARLEHSDSIGPSASDDKMVRLWDRHGAHSSGVVAIAFSPDGKLVAYGSYGSTVRLWGSASSAMCIRVTIGSYRALVMITKFSPDGKLVAFECETRMVGPWDPANGTVRLLSPANGTGQCTAIAFSPCVAPIAFSPNSKLLASASRYDETVRLLDLV